MLSALTDDVKKRYQRLKNILKSYNKVIVAYSGGVDSVFLLKVAAECLGSHRVTACIGVSESLARSEYDQAMKIAEQIGTEVKVVYPKEMDNPDYQANPADRCFFCKSELYQLLNEAARMDECDAVLCGTNADDPGDFRPGLQAARKFNVVSPLEEAGLTKADIRSLSKELGLPTWNKPAQPCLASRLPYGFKITPEKLKQIEEGETYLRSLGFKELRVRHHDKLVRIEVPAARIPELIEEPRRNEVVAFFKKLGFTFVSVDLQGFRSGSANETLNLL
ncbi:MAG: ATP-dependent sacrificial sulfur transferase LarE [Spirochaetota bacterium]